MLQPGEKTPAPPAARKVYKKKNGLNPRWPEYAIRFQEPAAGGNLGLCIYATAADMASLTSPNKTSIPDLTGAKVRVNCCLLCICMPAIDRSLSLSLAGCR